MDPDDAGSTAASLSELAALVRAHLEWESELGGTGLPAVTAAARAALHAEAPPTPRADAEARLRAAPSREPDAYATPPGTENAPSASSPRPASGTRDYARLTVLAAEAAACTRCRLHEGRTRSVFSRGSPDAEIAFVGEGPGYNEDQEGLPFVGPAGQLLDRMIAAMGYAVEDVYVCNVVKCRPPENRTPFADEAAACAPFLEEQLRLVAPRAIVALGRSATESLGLMPGDGRNWRGTLRGYQGVPVMPTYHPAFLLRSPQFKKQVWEDLKVVMAHLGKR